MTDWRRTFQAELFAAWRRAGLPDPATYERSYDELRAAAVPPPVSAVEAAGPLDPATLRSVHGFGFVMGGVFADLLDVRGHHRKSSIGWCARFNLGISLIDWLCDEANVPARDIAELPSLAPLCRRRASVRPYGHPAVSFLDNLAADLLQELTREAGPPGRGEPRSALWPSLRRLLRAELAAAEPGFFDPAHPRAALPVLRLKSVEPFRIMAERTISSGDEKPCASRVSEARQIGRAIGECIWLADDADDLWRDLDAGCGNLFVAEATAADAMVVSADEKAVVDIAVVRVLRRERLAERLATRAVGRLARALSSAPCAERERDLAAGLVGAALTRWSG